MIIYAAWKSPQSSIAGSSNACPCNVATVAQNLQVINAILYVAEHGCKWRGLPKRFGNWHTIYTRMNRWSKAGVLDRVFQELQHRADPRARSKRSAWTAPSSKCIRTAPGR